MSWQQAEQYRMEEKLWQRLGWVGLLRLLVGVSVCIAVGNLAARLAGFPIAPGWQGTFTQQPLTVAAYGLLGAALALVVGLPMALLIAPPVDRRMPAVVAATALAGFSLRGGTMGSVMLAANGREVFWLMALELTTLGILLLALFALWGSLRGPVIRREPVHGEQTALSVTVQLVVTLAALWVLGRNYQKAQGMMAVFLAAGIGAWGAHVAAGRLWRWAWMVPVIAGVVGYVIAALAAEGVETARVQPAVQGFVAALPLDYAGVGALGVVLGTLIAGGAKDEPDELAAT